MRTRIRLLAQPKDDNSPYWPVDPRFLVRPGHDYSIRCVAWLASNRRLRSTDRRPHQMGPQHGTSGVYTRHYPNGCDCADDPVFNAGCLGPRLYQNRQSQRHGVTHRHLQSRTWQRDDPYCHRGRRDQRCPLVWRSGD